MKPSRALLVLSFLLAALGSFVATELQQKAFASRNSSGTYSLPAGNPVSSGTTISSSWANNTLSDIGTELTNSLDRSGRGGMTAALQCASGSAAAPGLTFSAEPSSGLFRNGANDIEMSVGGTSVEKWTSGTVTDGSGSTNYMQLSGATTGNAPTIAAAGGDALINLNLNPKGTGTVNLAAQSADYFTFQGGASASNTVQMAPVGSDTNISVNLNGKGTGSLNLGTQNADFFALFGGASASNGVNLDAAGSDTNITLILNGKGTGGVQLGSGSTAITGSFAASFSPNFGTVANDTCSIITLQALTGAATTGVCQASWAGSSVSGVQVTCAVPSTNHVNIAACNSTGGSVVIGTSTVNVRVTQ